MLGVWDGKSFEVIKGQKPGMLAPLDKADGLIVTSKACDFLAKDQEVKIIAIKLDLKSEKKEDFFVK